MLDIEDDNLLDQEQKELDEMLEKYRRDPAVLDYKLDEIRKQNKKFDIISPDAYPISSLINDDKDTKLTKKGKDGMTTAADNGRKPVKGAKDKKDRDCVLI